MEFLLREITTDQGVVVYHDTELVEDVLTIGSAPEQLIQLRGGGISREHAVISNDGGQLFIRCMKNSTVIVNGAAVNKSALAIGDEILFACHKITIVQAPGGFDAAGELIIDDKLQDHTLESAYVTNLSQTVLAKRLPAYLLSLLVVLVSLAWPLSAYFLKDNTVTESSSVQQFNKSGGGDKLWTTGPLLPAHQLEIGNDCSACHQKPFETVQNNTCVNCHQGTADHAAINHPAINGSGDGSGVANTGLHSDLDSTQCQSCHKEHNEPAALVVSADKLCVDCHQDALKISDDSLGTPVITGFDKKTHPDFKLNYLLPTAVKKGTGFTVEWDNQLIERTQEQKDLSNLKFPHDIHLDAGKVQMSNTGEAMSCVNCHRLTSDNEHFAPITMEQHCSSCHDLAFDVEQPDRQLPHGEPSAVVQAIEEHFVRVYTDPNYKSAGSERRRLPGKANNAACTEKAFVCGMQRATTEAAIQFTQRGCVTCHEVSDNNSGDLYARWLVMPVNINNNWHGRALFDHSSHLTQSGKTADQACTTCHEAEGSSTSTDVLIPGIENCLSCHGDQSVEHIEDKVPVDCISCHAYHPAETALK